MKAVLVLLAGFLVLGATSTRARAQVETCAQKKAPPPDARLQAAVDALKAKFPPLVFEAGDACQRAKATSRALASTLRRNYLTGVGGFEYVKVVDGEGYFTIERFRLPKAAARKRFVAALETCQHCKLEIPENTCMAHFVADDSVVLMISAASACRASLEKFKQVERVFSEPPVP